MAEFMLEKVTGMSPFVGRGAQILMCYYCAESEQYLSLLTPSDVREELFT